MWRSAGAKDERQRIVVPFFSLLVKDLYFLNEGCANRYCPTNFQIVVEYPDCIVDFCRLPNGHINFEKFWQLAKQVTEFMTWKQVTCPFEKHPKVIHYLQTGTILSENGRKICFPTLNLTNFIDNCS